MDIGTSGCRAALLTRDGHILSTAEQSYHYHTNTAGFAELEPEKVYRSFMEVAQECLSQGLLPADLIIAGSMLHSLVLLDTNGTPLSPLSIWADTRANDQCAGLRDIYKREGWYQRTGCPLSPAYPLVRLIWYKENEPKLFSVFAKAASIKSFILFRLTGRFVEDHSTASGSGMLNIHTRCWDTDILDHIGLTADRLPDLVPVEHRFWCEGNSHPPAKSLLDRYCLVAGASDGPLAHLGSAGSSTTEVSVTLGTSGAVRIDSNRPQLAVQETLWCYILNTSTWINGIATNNGGNVFDWFIRSFLNESIAWAEVERMLNFTAFEPKLFFIPYVFGERNGLFKTDIRAGFVGMKGNHNSCDMLRAVLEGIVFNIVLLFRHLKSMHTVTRVFASGSVLKSPFAKLVLSSLIHEPLIDSSHINASLVGSARIIFGLDFDCTDDFMGPKQKRLNQHITALQIPSENLITDYNRKFIQWGDLVSPYMCSATVDHN
ncbi:MAG: gluconokinase [Anaerolineaceae bacterium]